MRADWEGGQEQPSSQIRGGGSCSVRVSVRVRAFCRYDDWLWEDLHTPPDAAIRVRTRIPLQSGSPSL